MISIVIPTYNEEKAIAGGIEQFLAYKKKYRLEIIVADGKSTDATARIARKLADRVIVEKKKTNIATGRNLGAHLAKGEIIIEIDADSRIADIDLFFRTIKSAFRSKKTVAAMPRLKVYPAEELFRDRFFHNAMYYGIWIANHFGSFLSKGECQVFRKSAFEKVNGYDQNIVVGEDCDLFHRLAKIGDVKILKGVTVYHSPRRFRKGGYFKTFVWIYLLEGIALLRKGKSHSREWKPVR